MSINFTNWIRGLVAALLAIGLLACGGGGVVPGGGVNGRSLSADFLNRKAVAYSPYRTANRFTETINDAMVLQDLQLLASGNFKLIRLFDSSDDVAARILRLLDADRRSNTPVLGGIKVMLGVSVGYGGETAEITRGIALANQYPEIVLAVSVGNETAVSWSDHKLTPQVLADYIKQVRTAIKQPVTTDDNWAFFAQYTGEANPRPVLDVIDFVSMHSYPLLDKFSPRWDYQQLKTPEAGRAEAMMNAAIKQVKDDYADVRSHLDAVGFSKMTVMVGETGWKADPSDGEYYRASPVNQKMYYDKLANWMTQIRNGAAGPFQMVVFAAFDEPWKGNDDKWGLFDVNRHARLVVQSLYPSVTASNSPAASNSTAALFYPDLANTAITANRYSLFANAVVPGESKLTALNWYGWDNGVAGWAGATTGAGALVGPDFVNVVPSTTKSWGWGVFISPTGLAPDLSAFASAGVLNFSIKTAYTGRLKIGFQSTIGGVTKDLFIDVGTSGSYGFARDGAWHSLSIPITAILDANPGVTAASAQAKLATIVTPFVIADTHADNAPNGTEPIYLDEIYWSK